MPAITILVFSAATPIRRALVAFGHSLAISAKHLGRAIKNRRAAQALARFDDRALADIGLTRSDVNAAYAKSLWGDPTNLLRARALERRLARHGISHGLAPDSAIAPPIVPKIDAAAVKQARVTFCNCT